MPEEKDVAKTPQLLRIAWHLAVKVHTELYEHIPRNEMAKMNLANARNPADNPIGFSLSREG